jgi:hypothetical protein
MFEAILDIVQREGKSLIIDNSQVPNQFNEDAMRLSAESLINGAVQLVQGGGLPALLSAIQAPDGAASAMSGAVGQLTAALTERCEVTPSAAATIAAQILPRLMQAVMSRVADPADTTFSVGNLMSLVMSRVGGGSNPLTQAVTKAHESGAATGSENDILGALGALMGTMGTGASKLK